MMNIKIIGSGGMGICLAEKFSALGHCVSIANSRGPESLQKLAAETGAKAESVDRVTKNKDVIIVSIPQKNVPDLPRHIFNDLDNATETLLTFFY